MVSLPHVIRSGATSAADDNVHVVPQGNRDSQDHVGLPDILYQRY